MWRYCKDYIVSKCEDGNFIVTTNGIWKNPLGVSLPVTNISEILDINIGDNILTTNTKILIAGKPTPILSTGLIRVGDYENQRYQYDRQNQYISYERK